MVDDRPSGTAVAVAFARAAVTRDRGAPGEGLDPFARDLLPSVARAVLDVLPVRVARALSFGVVDHCELRSLAIDAVVVDALERDVPQFVILGAGLDARALRLAAASRATVFEVDHPATQRYKRAHVPPGVHTAHFVAVDFELDSLDGRLAEAGHDGSKPTVWLWEGTTMYLAPEATRATIEVVARRSAPRSVLAVTYLTADMVNVANVLRPVVARAFAVIGEPLRGAVERAAFAETLASVGFRVVDDTGMDEWIARFHPIRPSRIRLAERLVTAHRE